MSTEPLPCPFCGETQIVPRFYGIGAGLDRWAEKYGGIECGACGARGPDVRTGYQAQGSWREDAIKVWNTRAADPSA